MTMYKGDYDDVYPAPASDWAFWWPTDITPYVAQQVQKAVNQTTFSPVPATLAIFRCPDDSQAAYGADFINNPNGQKAQRGWAIDYAGNGDWVEAPLGTTAHVKLLGPLAEIDFQATTPSSYGVPDSTIVGPSGTILIAEKHSDLSALPGYTYTDPVDKVGTSSNIVNCLFTNGAYGTGSPDQVPNGTASPSNTFPFGPNGAVTVRHSGMSNFLFCDGHVKTMNPVATNPDPINQPQNNMWDMTQSH